MLERNGIVKSVEEIQKGIFILKVKAPQIAKDEKPGQFCNVKVNESISPLLRRPFSICDVEKDIISFQFNLVFYLRAFKPHNLMHLSLHVVWISLNM